MKRYFSIFLSVSILFSLLAGLGGVFATDTISITADKTVLVVGQTATLTVTLPDGAESYSVVSNDESVVSVDDDSSLLSCSALEFGSAIITATCTVNGTSYTDSVTIKVRTPRGLISGEDYYVMNLQTGKFVAIPSGGDYNGAPLCGIARGTDARGKWTVEIAENGNGVTRLINVSSSSGRAMYINGSLDAVLYASTSSSVRSQIALHRVESGTYQGKYLMRYNGKFISMNSSNDVYLASSLNAGSYWTFMAVEKGSADLITFSYTFEKDGQLCIYDSTACGYQFGNVLSNKGYTTYYVGNQNISVSTAYNYLTQRDDIFVYRGHGGPGKLSFQTTNNEVTGKLYAHHGLNNSSATYEKCFVGGFNNQGVSENGLARLRCVLYLGCSTGVDGTRSNHSFNLLDETFAKGAHFVLGTTQTTYVEDSDNFLSGFLDKLNDDEGSPHTIHECIQEGISKAKTKDYYKTTDNPKGNYPYKSVGDANQYLD